MFLEFEGIHNGGYIGINHVKFYDKDENEIPYVNIQVDGQDVDHNEVQPAFPPNGWWAIWGDQHSVLFDFQEVKHVAEVHVWCANMSATPKIMYISDSKERAPSEEECQFEAGCYIQLAGGKACNPDEIDFRKSPKDKKDVVSCSEIVKMLNKSPPKDGFLSFLSGDGKCCYAFYRQGLKSQAYDYYFGLDSSRAVEFVNSHSIFVTEKLKIVFCPTKGFQLIKHIIFIKIISILIYFSSQKKKGHDFFRYKEL